MDTETQTPETDAAMAKTVPWAALGELCKKLERERDVALSDLEFRRDLYKIQSRELQQLETRYEEAMDELDVMKKHAHDTRIANRLREWLSMSDAEMRLQCGELSAQDIRNIRAILNEIYRRHE